MFSSRAILFHLTSSIRLLLSEFHVLLLEFKSAGCGLQLPLWVKKWRFPFIIWYKSPFPPLPITCFSRQLISHLYIWKLGTVLQISADLLTRALVLFWCIAHPRQVFSLTGLLLVWCGVSLWCVTAPLPGGGWAASAVLKNIWKPQLSTLESWKPDFQLLVSFTCFCRFYLVILKN